MERKKATDFPQELLNLFDHYVHGEISRRQFLDSAAKYAVGGLTATAIWDSLRPNYALAEQVPQDDKRLKTEYATVSSPQGNGSIRGYFVRPADANGKLPGVLVIHENRGLNPYIQDVARRLGTANFLAFAPDGLTSVGGYPGDDEKGAELFARVDENKMFEDFVSSVDWLRSRPECTGKVGVVGFCFGGTMANKLAVRLPDLAAAVPFYGRQPPAADAAKIKAPLLLHYAYHRGMARVRGSAQGKSRDLHRVCLRGGQSWFPQRHDASVRRGRSQVGLATYSRFFREVSPGLIAEQLWRSGVWRSGRSSVGDCPG